MKAYATASGGVIFVDDEIARKDVAPTVSYHDLAVHEGAGVDRSPLMVPDYSMAGDLAKTA